MHYPVWDLPFAHGLLIAVVAVVHVFIAHIAVGGGLYLVLTETLARTLVTSLTTLLVLVALAVFGGDMIHGFALALIVGVAIGTYSSIYVSATSLLLMGISKEDLMIPVKEGVEVDELP